MLDKKALTQVVERALEGTDLFLVEVTITADNIIEVWLDSDTDISIDQCVAVNDAVLGAFNRDEEDYQLTVGSYGISAPLIVPRQYRKNIGNEVEVTTTDGRRLKGVITVADGEKFTLEVPTRVKPDGQKRPTTVLQAVELDYAQVKQTKCIISF